MPLRVKFLIDATT